MVQASLVECYSNHIITWISMGTAGLAFGGTGLCSYRVRGVDRLTWVVPDNRSLNRCVCVYRMCSLSSWVCPWTRDSRRKSMIWWHVVFADSQRCGVIYVTLLTPTYLQAIHHRTWPMLASGRAVAVFWMQCIRPCPATGKYAFCLNITTTFYFCIYWLGILGLPTSEPSAVWARSTRWNDLDVLGQSADDGWGHGYWAFFVPLPSVLDIVSCLRLLLLSFPWLLRKSHQAISFSFATVGSVCFYCICMGFSFLSHQLARIVQLSLCIFGCRHSR